MPDVLNRRRIAFIKGAVIGAAVGSGLSALLTLSTSFDHSVPRLLFRWLPAIGTLLGGWYGRDRFDGDAADAGYTAGALAGGALALSISLIVESVAATAGEAVLVPPSVLAAFILVATLGGGERGKTRLTGIEPGFMRGFLVAGAVAGIVAGLPYLLMGPKSFPFAAYLYLLVPLASLAGGWLARGDGRPWNASSAQGALIGQAIGVAVAAVVTAIVGEMLRNAVAYGSDPASLRLAGFSGAMGNMGPPVAAFIGAWIGWDARTADHADVIEARIS